ncbi:hypothetical protein FHU38_000953 [Saccharomonospora amisosensis]|uniref:Uncharacterized protein n=1 Tax=Saccharomonospora amisosensis TaxID=1128677 RepID=A0A7X5UM88_9PSEU|nr:hypothetical protein [Saccharomonospora amisosensis]NIJ10609.1 hypothetical protein [Saccharomonospora amisosensis]
MPLVNIPQAATYPNTSRQAQVGQVAELNINYSGVAMPTSQHNAVHPYCNPELPTPPAWACEVVIDGGTGGVYSRRSSVEVSAFDDLDRAEEVAVDLSQVDLVDEDSGEVQRFEPRVTVVVHSRDEGSFPIHLTVEQAGRLRTALGELLDALGEPDQDFAAVEAEALALVASSNGGVDHG